MICLRGSGRPDTLFSVAKPRHKGVIASFIQAITPINALCNYQDPIKGFQMEGEALANRARSYWHMYSELSDWSEGSHENIWARNDQSNYRHFRNIYVIAKTSSNYMVTVLQCAEWTTDCQNALSLLKIKQTLSLRKNNYENKISGFCSLYDTRNPPVWLYVFGVIFWALRLCTETQSHGCNAAMLGHCV